MIDDARRRRLRSWLLPIVSASSLLAIFGATFAEHVRLSADPLIFNDDVRAFIYPFYRYADSALLQQDFAGEYHLACYPRGLRLFYGTAAGLFDIAVVSKVMAYVLLLVTLALLAVAAWRLGRWPAVWGAIALFVGSSYPLSRMVGANPRSYAFPLVAGTFAALLAGRPLLMAAAVVLGAAIYPSAAVFSGATLALFLLLLPAADRGAATDWSLRRRLGLLAATALAAGLVVLPVWMASTRYGSMIMQSDFEEFPEAGPQGRLSSTTERVEESGILLGSRWLLKKTLIGEGEPLLPPARALFERRSPGRILLHALTGVMLLGWFLRARSSPEARRLLAFVAAAVICFHVSRLAYPFLYLPQRYLGYSIPLLVAILLPSGVVAISTTGASRSGIPQEVAAWAGVVALLLLVGGRGAPNAGFRVRIDPGQQIYDAVRGLPTNALVAGWPRGVVDNIPYVTQRATLVGYETHQPYHDRYVLEMRRRMEAIVAAYWARSPEPLVALREEFGATHLLLDLRHLRQKKPLYFEPFNPAIERAFNRARSHSLEALRQADQAAVYRDARYLLLDLSAIRGD